MFLLYAYSKGDKENLSIAERNELKRQTNLLVDEYRRQKRVKKKSNHLYEGIRRGLEEAVGYARDKTDKTKFKAHIPVDLDVKAIREHTGMTQEEFAMRYGFNLARLRDLEQKRTHPDSVVRAYLLVIKKERKAVEHALAVA